MKVILLADVKKLGKKDQTIEVSDGYAVNYLFPRKLAVQVTKKSVEVLENQQEQRREEDAKMKADAQVLANKLKDLKFGASPLGTAVPASSPNGTSSTTVFDGPYLL